MTLRAIEPLYVETIQERRSTLANEFVQHSFTDLACTPLGQRGSFRTSLAVHSVFGPYVSSMRPVDATSIEFAIDPRGPSFFGWARQMVTFNPNTGVREPWPVTGLGDLSGDSVRLAFDTRRNRLLLWGRHGLTAIDVLTKQATLVRDGRGGTHQTHALAYSENDDLLYGLVSYYDGNSSKRQIKEILTLNHLGADVSATKLAVPIPVGEIKLRVVNGKLLLMHHGSFDGNSNLIPFYSNFVIDPHTGKVLFTCQRKPR
jgi:hypothetical protein